MAHPQREKEWVRKPAQEEEEEVARGEEEEDLRQDKGKKKRRAGRGRDKEPDEAILEPGEPWSEPRGKR